MVDYQSMTFFCSRIMMKSVGLFSDGVTLLHQRRRMWNNFTIPVWREFCPGVKHVCIFIFLLNSTKCPSHWTVSTWWFGWFIYYHGHHFYLREESKRNQKPPNIPFSPLLPLSGSTKAQPPILAEQHCNIWCPKLIEHYHSWEYPWNICCYRVKIQLI